MNINKKRIGSDGETEEEFETLEQVTFVPKRKNTVRSNPFNRSLLIGLIIGFSAASAISLLAFKITNATATTPNASPVALLTTNTPSVTAAPTISGIDTACLTSLSNNHNRILSSEQIDKFTKLVLTDDQGSAICQISDNAAGSDFGPSWFPDGKTIAFGSSRNSELALYTMTIGVPAIHLVTNDVTAVTPYIETAVSPDGKHIAFTSNAEINEIDIDGTHRKRLTNFQSPGTVIGAISWSRDTIIFDSSATLDHQWGDHQLYSVNPDGSNLRAIPTPSESYDASVSPDGQKIAFVSGGGLTVMNSDGSNIQSLNRSGDSPSWSPDSQYLVVRTISAPNTIDILKADGTFVRHIVHNTRSWGGVAWQP